MKPIIKWTIQQRKASTIWWCVGIALFIFLAMIFYPSFKSDAAELEATFADLPDAALQLFGGSADFFSPVGYTNSQVYFISLPLLLGVLSISLGSKVIAKEENDKTIEGLLARPLSRTQLLLGKSVAASLILALVSLVAAVTMVITAIIIDLEISITNLLVASFMCYLLTICFGAVALTLTTVGRASGIALGAATLVAFGGYLIDSLAGTITWLEIPAKIFPFHYYQSESILQGNYNWWNILYFVAFLSLSSVISFVSFRRRDLN